MINLETEVNSRLRNWGAQPVFLQANHDGRIAAISSREFSDQIEDIALQLSSWGIGKKYVVPVFLENSPDFIAVFMALLRIGAIPVMAKLECRTMELDEIFSNAEPQAVIAEKTHLKFLKAYLTNRIVITHAENRFSIEQSAEGLASREDIPDDIASINYTYRGYGYPLGAMISHAQYLHGARVLQDGLRVEAGEKMLVMLPMTHIFTIVGCILVPLLYQATSVIVDTMHPRLLFQHIRDLRIDYVTSVPEIYEMLSRLRGPGVDLSSLKVLVSGGSFLSPESYATIKAAFSADLCQGYGLTEFTPVSANRREEARSGTVGPPCDQVACSFDFTASPEAGEILIKTPHGLGFYYRRHSESADAHRDGWFRTGDTGRMEDGHLVFVKEKKRTRKINGNLVDLEEVARAIRMDKDVADVQVGWENNSLFANLAVSRHVDFDEKARRLKSGLREILAEFKIPRRMTAAWAMQPAEEGLSWVISR